MKTLDPHAGLTLHDVLCEAVRIAPCRFKFNDWTFETRKGETLGDARARFQAEHGFEVQTNEEMWAAAAKRVEETKTTCAAAIAKAKVPTEADLRDAKAPWPNSSEELTAYISSLVDRPHDYGTCCYAMSLAAVAAFNYVAGKLGVTGFQSSVADMDILRRTRGLEIGKILDYANLIYPQYCNEEHFPSAVYLLNDVKLRPELRKRADAKLEECKGVGHPAVIAHWRRIVSDQPFTAEELDR